MFFNCLGLNMSSCGCCLSRNLAGWPVQKGCFQRKRAYTDAGGRKRFPRKLTDVARVQSRRGLPQWRTKKTEMFSRAQSAVQAIQVITAVLDQRTNVLSRCRGSGRMPDEIYRINLTELSVSLNAMQAFRRCPLHRGIQTMRLSVELMLIRPQRSPPL